MKEWLRTFVLLLLLGLAIGFMIWSNNSAQANFVQSL